MQRIFGCVLLLACGAAAAQTPTGRSTLTLIDPTRGNREIPLELYYPATSAGTDVPFAAGAFYALLDLLVLAAVSALARSVADPGVQPAEQSLAAQARSE